MAIKIFKKYIKEINHNITLIKLKVDNIYIDKICGINKNGEERLIKNISEVVNNISVSYEEEFTLLHIYYDDLNGTINDAIFNNLLETRSSYSRYSKYGSIHVKEKLINGIFDIVPIVEYENIGDCHISAKYNITLLDENNQTIKGYEIYYPISSDSILYSEEVGNRFYSKYGYIEDKKIDDEELLINNSNVLVFAIPKNEDENILLTNKVIQIVNINASSFKISGTIFITNTDFTKKHHTPIIKTIGMVLYKWI